MTIFLQNWNISSQFKEFVKFRKTKIKPLISIKMDFLIQIVYVSLWTILPCSDFSEKWFLVNVNAKYFLLETEWRRLGDTSRGTEPGGFSANLEAQRSFMQGSWGLCTPSLVGGERRSKEKWTWKEENKTKKKEMKTKLERKRKVAEMIVE